MDACACDAVQFLFVVCDTGAKATHGEARSHNQWIAELLSDLTTSSRNERCRNADSALLPNDLLKSSRSPTTVDKHDGSADQPTLYL